MAVCDDGHTWPSVMTATHGRVRDDKRAADKNRCRNFKMLNSQTYERRCLSGFVNLLLIHTHTSKKERFRGRDVAYLGPLPRSANVAVQTPSNWLEHFLHVRKTSFLCSVSYYLQQEAQLPRETARCF